MFPMVSPIMGKAKTAVRVFAQHLFITLEIFHKNGLANHAAAGAYGFLLSAAPMLLVISFFLIRAFRAAPETAIAMARNVPFLDISFYENWPALEFLTSAPPGIPALVSMVGILWAGRIFAVSLHRGLKIVFEGKRKRNPLTENLVTLAIEFMMLVVMLAVIMGSRIALRLYDAVGFFGDTPLPRFLESMIGSQVLRLAVLGFLLYTAYRLIPANPPGRPAALFGGVFCVVGYGAAAILFDAMLGHPRYNFLYGALGDLFVLLVSVYVFFLFLFLGAQFAAVADSFDALFFLRLREARFRAARKPLDRLFGSIDGKLKKYHRFYRRGEIVLSKGDQGTDVYFLLEGEVEILIPSGRDAWDSVGTLKPGSFLGEMGFLLSEGRTATIRATTDARALALPSGLFETILESDVSLDRSIIENLSRRIKKGNERIAALEGVRQSGLP